MLLLLLLLLSRFSRVRLCATPRPWDSLGKNTGVGCHVLLQCMKVKSESEIAQSCLTLRSPMDCSPPGSSVHGIFQARALEWVPPPSPVLYRRTLLFIHAAYVQFNCSVLSDSVQPHRLQHSRLPCPSPTPGVCSNSHPSSQ